MCLGCTALSWTSASGDRRRPRSNQQPQKNRCARGAGQCRSWCPLVGAAGAVLVQRSFLLGGNGFPFSHRGENESGGERMSFKISCPHCKRTLSVTEKAVGKTGPCPVCNKPVTVPKHPETSSSSQRLASVKAAPLHAAAPPAVVPPPSVPSRRMHRCPGADAVSARRGWPRQTLRGRPPTGIAAQIKIPCPFCGDSIAYEESLGGKTIACGYCKSALKIPYVTQLPQEYQDEFRHVQEKLTKKAQAAEVKRLKAQQNEEGRETTRSGKKSRRGSAPARSQSAARVCHGGCYYERRVRQSNFSNSTYRESHGYGSGC